MNGGHAPSIVMFTRNRPHLVQRLVRYHADYPAEVIVLDGSAAPQDDLRAPGNCRYLHLPGTTVNARTSTGLAMVRSEACILSADDDYLLHGALLECGALIASDPRVAYATGTSVHFIEGERSADRAIAADVTERVLDLRGGEAPAERFRALASRDLYHGLFYGCLRTSVAQRVSAMLADLSDQHALVGEQLWALLPSLFGEYRMLDRLLCCRRFHPRDYSSYIAAMSSLEDIAHWSRFDEFSGRIRALAAEAGIDALAADEVIEAWRAFAAETGRGRRGVREGRATLGAVLRRRVRGLVGDVGVAVAPRAWRNRRERLLARNKALRILLRCGAYPWRDPAARHAFEGAMEFDLAPLGA